MGRGFRVTVGALFCALFMTSICRGGGAPEILDERIAVELDPPSHLLTGVSTVTVGPHSGGRMEFELSPAATVLGVTVDGKVVPFDVSGGKLAVRIPPGMEEKGRRIADRLSRRLQRSAAGTGRHDRRPLVRRERSHRAGGDVSRRRGGVVPAPPGRAGATDHRSHRAGRHGGGDGRSAPGTAGNGGQIPLRLEGRTPHARPLPLRRPLPGRRTKARLPPPLHLFPADSAPLSSAYLDASARYLRFYEGLFGPYPFEKFAVVENFIPTGYGFPSYTLLGGTVIRLPFILTTSLPHEIAHNWWGNGVLVDYREGNWSEGLVTYVADYLLEEQKSPAAGREYRFKLLTDYASLVPPAADFPVAAFVGRSDPASRAIGYGKGAMIFHMVRRLIGDEAFFAALRDVCRERLYREAAWSDFTRAFSRAAGRDLAPLMKQWLERTGGPRISLADVTSRPEGGKWVVSGKVIQASPPWSFPPGDERRDRGGRRPADRRGRPGEHPLHRYRCRAPQEARPRS